MCFMDLLSYAVDQPDKVLFSCLAGFAGWRRQCDKDWHEQTIIHKGEKNFCIKVSSGDTDLRLIGGKSC